MPKQHGFFDLELWVLGVSPQLQALGRSEMIIYPQLNWT